MSDEPINDPGLMEAEVRSGTSGTTAGDDLSEVLDEDKMPAEFPPDEPTAVFDYGVTPQEQRVQEALADRVEREVPEVFEQQAERGGDPFVGEEGIVGRLVAPDEGVHEDDEATAVADDVNDRVAGHDLPVGDVGTGDTTTYDVATEHYPDLSAEEAAVHEREAP